MVGRRTYREVDGERIEGTWRHIFIHNGGTYFLTDLLVYADGLIDCWGPVTIDGLREKLRTGWVVTRPPQGGRASAHHLASWRFDDPLSWVDADDLVGEVADEIDQLNDRADSSRRCLEAVERYRQDPTEENRRSVRVAYNTIPRHLRMYVLSDQDRKDGPLRILITDIGQRLDGDGPTVTAAMHREALEYFQRRDRTHDSYAPKLVADGPQGADDPSIVIEQRFYPRGWPDDPGLLVLRNEFPSPIVLSDVEFATVTHAYWSLSTADAGLAESIRVATQPYDAQRLAEAAPRRTSWAVARVAMMHMLLREKFTQHPPMADVLTDTGDARLLYTDVAKQFWAAHGATGRNWIGRLLEVVRSELVAKREGLL